MADKKNIEIISNSVEKTLEIGRKIGELLEPEKVVCFTGPLGSGKTTLIKGIADYSITDSVESSWEFKVE